VLFVLELELLEELGVEVLLLEGLLVLGVPSLVPPIAVGIYL
jgi:hypothetical protein